MRVLVCGGRRFPSPAQVYRYLDDLHAATPITALIQGGCPTGVDRFAKEWAQKTTGIVRYECKADWAQYGAAAGPKRNARMLTWNPDVVIAFAGGKGTADMVRRARAAGVRVVEVG